MVAVLGTVKRLTTFRPVRFSHRYVLSDYAIYSMGVGGIYRYVNL